MDTGIAPNLGLDTRLVLLSAGLMFLWALGLGVQKYVQILKSEVGSAHPYTDIAHRAALLYSFALLLTAAFAELSAWPLAVDLTAAAILFLYFAQAVAAYMFHGLVHDTENQFRGHVPGWKRIGMVSLIVAEIGAFAVLVAGFTRAAF